MEENDIKGIIAKNIIELRKASNMKQSELAEKLNYSDKSVSKWESGDSLPAIDVLYNISTLFGISLDDLVKENAVSKIDIDYKQNEKAKKNSKIILLTLAICTVSFAISFAFLYFFMTKGEVRWKLFPWIVPASCVLGLFYNRETRSGRVQRFVFSTVLTWSLLTSIYLSFLVYEFWMIYFLGLPLQAIILVLFFLGKKGKRK